MTDKSEDRSSSFHHAWEIINKDPSIPSEEKKGILKLIQTLVEVAEASSDSQGKGSLNASHTQDIVSRHSLMALVKQQADELELLKKPELEPYLQP